MYDGSGAPPVTLDLGVRGERIQALGSLPGASAACEIDASGLAVAPGFIDTHTHSDVASLLGDEHESVTTADVRQGVTTEICGNCGFSPFPFIGSQQADLERLVGGLFGPASRVWADLAAYSAGVRRAGLFANLGPLVGHGSLRAGVIGFANRPLQPDELQTVIALLEGSLDQGALGLSSGLVYAPGFSAPTEELVELCRVVGRRRRPYTTHMRGETSMLATSLDEALRIGRESGAAVHISHHKAAGKANWGRTEETLAMIDLAREHGQDVTLDMYP